MVRTQGVNQRLRIARVAALLAGSLLMVAACSSDDKDDAATLIANAGNSTANFSCGLLTVPFGANVPGDAPILTNQVDANCFAWWEFISLNWPNDSGAGFGDPGDLNGVQWETYIVKQLLFPSGGSAPPAWGTQPPVPSYCDASTLKSSPRGAPARQLSTSSKLAAPQADEFDFPDDSQQAAPTDAPNWLGAQNGTNVWYEIRLNQDEYQYIVNQKFYDANQQQAWTDNGQPIVLPKGTSTGTTGAIELKASWLEVPDPSDAKWQRYKLADTWVIDPISQACRQLTVALVGLHILHKTESQPTWIWATFEHVDNVPGSAGGQAPYNFYNANCQAQQVEVGEAACLAKNMSSPVTVSCTPNTPPPYYLGENCPAPVPIQVSRQVPLDSSAQQANTIAQKAIASTYPKSVFQNYQLVNVIWSTNPSQDPSKPVAVPMPLTSMLPTSKVANTTLETYVQNLTCTDCHRYATIAPTSAAPDPQWDSDFSFAVGAATPAASSASSALPTSFAGPGRE